MYPEDSVLVEWWANNIHLLSLTPQLTMHSWLQLLMRFCWSHSDNTHELIQADTDFNVRNILSSLLLPNDQSQIILNLPSSILLNQVCMLTLIVTKMCFCAIIVTSSPNSIYGKQLYSIGSAFCYSQTWFISIKKSVWRQATFMKRFSPIRTVMLGIIFKCKKMTTTASIIRNIFQSRNGYLESNIW